MSGLATSEETMAADLTRLDPPDEGDQVVSFFGIGWGGYRTMLRIRGERSNPRMIYLDGDLLLVSPSHTHEWLKERFGALIVVLIEELNIPCILSGSTTYKRRKKEAGFEPDQSYYLANHPRIRGKKNIHLKTDPPPDLAIEVVYSHDADAALEVCRRLGVPEVWVRDESGLSIKALGGDGEYAEAEVSLSFPTLNAAEVFAWVTKEQETNDTDWIKDVRAWVRDVLAPRLGDGSKGPGRTDPAGKEGRG